ncbi:MAG: hypothetical protein AB1486_15725 [Planctomycetota bacterium]
MMVPSEHLTFIVLADTQNLSRPFQLGLEGVSVLASPFALAFFKAFVLQRSYDESFPEINWTADVEAVVQQLAEITDPELRELHEDELWTYRKLYSGVGRDAIAAQLLAVHTQAFADFEPSAVDLYQVGRPGPRPPKVTPIRLSKEETARWVGRYVIRPADAGKGLPAEMELRECDGHLVGVTPDGECKEFLPLTPTRLAASDNPELLLVAEGEEKPFQSVLVEFRGGRFGTYGRSN